MMMCKRTGIRNKNRRKTSEYKKKKKGNEKTPPIVYVRLCSLLPTSLVPNSSRIAPVSCVRQLRQEALETENTKEICPRIGVCMIHLPRNTWS